MRKTDTVRYAVVYPAKVAKYPAIFAAGWLFNFVVDIKFMSGFMAGWFAHTWLGGIFS